MNVKGTTIAAAIVVAAFSAGYFVGVSTTTEQGSDQLVDQYLPLIALNDATWQIQVICYARIPSGLSLHEKCRHLAKELSKHSFHGLPIDVPEIEVGGSGRVAVINLREDTATGRRWVGGFFEGSTGGAHTSTALVETMLQRDYQGEWVNGVRFLHDGEPIDGDHVPSLYGISWKETIK